MKIVVTGATGFIGRQLVPLLRRGGAELLLVGRDPEAVRTAFPDHPTCSYAEISEKARGFDQLVHLATVNSDTGLPLDETRMVNVGLLVDVVGNARKAGITRVVNISSTHALREQDDSAYAKTKREAAQWLRSAAGKRDITLYLPPVYGERWSGKLGVLNSLPQWLSLPLFRLASALTPTLNVERLAGFLLAPPSDAEHEFILTDGQQDNGVYRFIKRSLDLGFAVVILVFFWWLLAIVWLAVRLQSSGPAIFAQARVGQNGDVFTCYKFRTMKMGTIQAATNEVSLNAVTTIGHFLRRTKLDELPQIWNIFRNEVSLIGPRPCLPVQESLVEARARRGVLALKPGISGLSQINDIDMSDPERLAVSDARYLALQSLLLDLRIILATATGHGRSDRVAPNRTKTP